MVEKTVQAKDPIRGKAKGRIGQFKTLETVDRSTPKDIVKAKQTKRKMNPMRNVETSTKGKVKKASTGRHTYNEKVLTKKEQVIADNNKAIDKYQKQVNAKKGIWLDTLSDDLYDKLIDMNYSDASIALWQKKRLIQAVVLGGLLLVAGLVTGKLGLMAAAPVLSLGLFFITGHKIKSAHARYKFYRAMQFAQFTRLVFPYLWTDSMGGTESRVHSTLSAVLERLDNDEDKRLLATLLNEIAQTPDTKEPYVNYAKKVANDDFSLTFMESLFDIRQGSASLNIIERLSKESNEQIQNLIEDIIAMKSRKFLMYPTKVSMTSIVIIIGCTVAIIMQNVKGFSF